MCRCLPSRRYCAGNSPCNRRCKPSRPCWSSRQYSWQRLCSSAPTLPGRLRRRIRWTWTPVFSGWLQDYCTLAQVQHQKHFFFIPQGSINTPQEFTAALQAYAEEKGMQFALTKEGMYPEFSLDGIAYKAYRNPGKYRDEICCDAMHPAQLDAGLPPRREKLLRILRIAMPPVCTFSAILAAGWLVTGGAGWLWLAVLVSAGVLLGRCLERWL